MNQVCGGEDKVYTQPCTSGKCKQMSAIGTEPILYPKTIVRNGHEESVVVADQQIERGIKFGPFPGTDAVEKENSGWMQRVTTVQSLRESNLLICFMNNQMYFYCNRLIYDGTELVVWGGTKCMHFADPISWDLRGINDHELTFLCQDCHRHFSTETGLYAHWNVIHKKPEEQLPEKNCICTYCGKVIGNKNHFRIHILQHGINLSKETLYRKLKKCKGGKKRTDPIRIQQ